MARRPGPLAFTLAILAGCAEPTVPGLVPDPVWRTYALTELRSQELPADFITLPGETLRIVAETLFLREDLSVVIKTRYTRIPAAGPPHEWSSSYTTTYVVNGDSMVVGAQVMCITFPCPDWQKRGPFTADAANLVLEDSVLFTYARVPD